MNEQEDLINILKFGKCDTCKKNIAQEEHTCPYFPDLNNLCNSCEKCHSECSAGLTDLTTLQS